MIVNYRLGRHTQRRNQCIIEIAGVEDKNQAAKLIGKKIIWSSPKGKQITGRVVSPHGNKGLLLAAFEKSLPQAVGVKVKIAD